MVRKLGPGYNGGEVLWVPGEKMVCSLMENRVTFSNVLSENRPQTGKSWAYVVLAAAVPLTSCVILGKSCDSSSPECPYLESKVRDIK